MELRLNLYRNFDGDWILFETDVTGARPDSPSDDGYFKFCAPPGEYYLEVDISPLHQLVPVVPFVGMDTLIDSDFDHSNGPNTTQSFTVQSGDEICHLAAGFYPMAQLGDYVWYDANINGVQDIGEPYFHNIKVDLYDEFW